MILYPKVGSGIRNSIAGGLCKREDLFVTSKLWNTYHHPQHVEAACRKSLEDLGLDYLDLYLIHFPISLKFVPFDVRYPPEWIYDPSAEEKRMEFQPVSVRDTWAAMESLVDKGLVRNIGLSNWNCQGLRDVLTYARIKPAVLQIEVATNENISLFYLRNIQYFRSILTCSARGWSATPSRRGWSSPPSLPSDTARATPCSDIRITWP